MFKNYHIIIFKDREGVFRNLRFRGWILLALLVVMGSLAGLSLYLWEQHSRAKQLEYELEEARRTIQTQDNQLLSLTGKLQDLDENMQRVRQFDSKLHVLMNIGIGSTDQEDPEPKEQEGREENGEGARRFRDPVFLSRHRDLFSRHVHSVVDELTDNVQLEEVKQQTLVGFLRSNKESLFSIPSVWPVKGYLTSGFGLRRAPTAGASRMHKGLDIANRVGTAVQAPADGKVTFSGYDGAYGLCITIDHGNGLKTRYAHLHKSAVKPGDEVLRGEVIGALGNTGRSTGPHLHYEVHVNGVPVNPMRYILN